jgi:predicted Zn-dependent protease
MPNRFVHATLILLLLVSVTGSGYFGVRKIIQNPCSTPKTWSIGSVDPRFGVDEETVRLYAGQAAKLWNDTYANNQLLTYSPTGGDIIINFVYDERQRTTIQNEKLKQAIEADKTELTDLKQTIEQLQSEYATLGSKIDKDTQNYTSKLAEYNADVKYWNDRGGAPNDDYQRLQRSQVELENSRASLNASINRYNRLAEDIKNYSKNHNQVVGTINQKIETLNDTALREFEEGSFDPSTDIITIYEYSDATSLKRVLAHELGHAIGLKHVDDKSSIMYSVNQGSNFALTKDDKTELDRICRDRSANDVVEMMRTTRDGISHLVVSSLPGIAALLR